MKLQKIFPVRTDDGYIRRIEKLTSFVRSLPEEKMLAIVPEQSGIYFTDCPNCEFGTQDRGNFDWSPERPEEIVCSDCGEKYPGNEKYPDEKFIDVAAGKGKARFFCYTRPEDRYRIFFRAHAAYWARRHMEEQAEHLAELYWTTKRDEHAVRAARILLRFAEVYPKYACHYDLPFRQKKFAPGTETRIKGAGKYRTAKWEWWAYMDISRRLTAAYDALRFWPGLSKMDDGRAIQRIENDLLGPMVESVLGIRESYSNMSPGTWRDIIYAGRVLRRPDWVHEAVRRFETFTEQRFLHDGHWMETASSYCSQVIGGLRVVMNAAKGHTDPPEYKDEIDGRRFEDLDLAKLVPVVEAANQALLGPRFPNGQMIPVNDTWSFSRRSARTSMKPLLLPGLGVAVLGGGNKKEQVHAYLNFTGGRQHKHYDALSIGLFIFGKELLRDIGYTHTRYRAWTLTTMSHNTVVVNGLDSKRDRDYTGHRLRAFVTDGQGFHLAEAESVTAYPEEVSRYRRTLMMVGTDATNCYLVDLFQVTGGSQHDYLLHGSADEDSVAKIHEADLKPFKQTLMNPGVQFVQPRGETDMGMPGSGYGFVRNLTSAVSPAQTILDLRLKTEPGIGTRTFLSAGSKTTLFLGEAPSIRRSQKVDETLDKYQSPFFCARRKGKDLSSVFAAVHEPVNGRPKIEKVEVWKGKNGVVFEVNHGDTTDLIVVALDGPLTLRRETSLGRLDFKGRYGMVRQRKGKVIEAHLIGSKEINIGSFRLASEPGWGGIIRKVDRNASVQGSRGWFEVQEEIPSSTRGAFVVTHPDGSTKGYNLSRVEKLESGTRLHVKESPGFEVTREKTRSVSYPQRVIDGTENRYELLEELHFKLTR